MTKKLVQCKDCGKDVSRSARTCPHCGAKKPYKSTGCFTVIVIFILLLILVGIFSGDSEGQDVEMKADPYSQIMEIYHDTL
ncbi:MAG: hypothetical protein OXC41_08170 [Gammaproteobacteria bacterium]|nr:hypothetical protein [Gammaproteobacteria bacterium]